MAQHSYSIRNLIAFIIFFTSTILTLAVAAPIDDAPSLFKRACLTIDFFREHIRKKGMSTNTVFYTSPASALETTGFAAALTPPGKFFSNLVTPEDQLKFLDECGTNGAEQEKIAIRLSIAIAREASGIAYVVVKDKAKEGSIWKKYELPALQHNPNIASIHEFDINTKQYTQIWTKGDTPTLTENPV